ESPNFGSAFWCYQNLGDAHAQVLSSVCESIERENPLAAAAYFLRNRSSCTTSAPDERGRLAGAPSLAAGLGNGAGSGRGGSEGIGGCAASSASATKPGTAEAMCWRARSLAAPGLPNRKPNWADGS